MERVFSGTRVLRGRDFRRKCRNRPVSENRVKFDSRRLKTSLTLGLPEPLAERYFASIRAPQKELFRFEESAHSPMFAEPARMCGILRRIVAREDR
ncbi:MAG: hypothetical protein NTY02_16385 [Acidobacteria bacterium]|nr:hypothetical protein [Acidobacteriota bacterium]